MKLHDVKICTNVFRIMTLRAAVFLAMLAGISEAHAQGWVPDQSDLLYNQPYTQANVVWNGKKVYLSTARHANTGNRGECLNQSENSLSFSAAIFTAVVEQSGGPLFYPLRKRGYKTLVGRAKPSAASTRSNNWMADVHIPIHSNSVSGPCRGNNPFAFFTPGTKVAYRSTAGSNLAEKLRSQVGNNSPGTNDVKVCVKPAPNACACPNAFGPCSLLELNSTTAPAAYLETEFHQWNQGANFLKNRWDYTYRIAEAIDSYFGYPRN